MDTQPALKILQSAVDRCRINDVNTPQTHAPLNILEARASIKWPFQQFREVLKDKTGADWEIEGRGQMLNASMNGIRRAVRDVR